MLMRSAAPPMDLRAPSRPALEPSAGFPSAALPCAGSPRGVLLPLLGRWFSLSCCCCSAPTRGTRAVAGGCRTARGVMPVGSADASRALLGMLLPGLLLPEGARLESASRGTATGAGLLGWPNELRRLMETLPLLSLSSRPAAKGAGVAVLLGV